MAIIEMTIDSLRVNPMDYQRRAVILKEKEVGRYLPIWMGAAEGDAIAVKLQGVSLPRPMTHDLLCSIADIAGLKIKSVIINHLKKDTFYAKVVLTSHDKSYEMDCRPSDALAVAVRVGAPIFADEKILDKVAIFLDEEGKPTALPPEKITAIKDESEKKPSQFEIFSEAAKDILSLAEEEAKRLNHGFVGTGHLLLALLVNKTPTIASIVLGSLGFNLAKAVPEIEASINQLPSIELSEVGLTSAVKKTIELSVLEAKRLGNAQVQPEHILIGLIRHDGGVGANLLKNLGVNVERIYIEVIRAYTQSFRGQQF